MSILPPTMTPSRFREAFPRLREWTIMAARAYGAYSGINEAIARSAEKWPSAAHLAAEYRQELALMAILRAYTIMDRDGDISFQKVQKLFAYSDATLAIAKLLVRDGDYISPALEKNVNRAIAAFLEVYQTIDWDEFGHIQRFRNTALAHATWKDIKSGVTFGSIERLVRIECEMCHQLALLYSGSGEHPASLIEHAHANSSSFWLSAIKADAADLLEW